MLKNVIYIKLHIIDFILQKEITKSGYDLFCIYLLCILYSSWYC